MNLYTFKKIDISNACVENRSKGKELAFLPCMKNTLYLFILAFHVNKN